MIELGSLVSFGFILGFGFSVILYFIGSIPRLIFTLMK
jgi:hypothetical protein